MICGTADKVLYIDRINDFFDTGTDSPVCHSGVLEVDGPARSLGCGGAPGEVWYAQETTRDREQ